MKAEHKSLVAFLSCLAIFYGGGFLFGAAHVLAMTEEPPCHQDFEYDPKADTCIRRVLVNVDCGEFDESGPDHRVIVEFTHGDAATQVADIDVVRWCEAEAAGDE